MYLLHLHLRFRVALGFILERRLTHLRMPHAVSVRKVSGLPRASFRFRLAADTLAFGYALGATPCVRDFHPLEHAHAGRTFLEKLLRSNFSYLAPLVSLCNITPPHVHVQTRILCSLGCITLF